MSKSNILKAQIPNSISPVDKQFGLSKFWSDVNNNFVYLYKIDQEQWNQAYKEAIAAIQETKNDYEYFRELQRLCALLKDGHTQVFLPEALENQIMITNFGEYRILLSHVQGKVYVSNVNKSKSQIIPIGSEVIKVNGLPTREYQQQYVLPFISSSTEGDLLNKAAYNLLSGFEGDQYRIEIKTPKGKIEHITLTHSESLEKEWSSIPKGNQELSEFKWLKDKIGYFAIRSFDDVSVVQDFEENLPELQKAESIIIDLRDNGGGSGRNALNVAKYFVEGDSIYGARNYSREIIPTERAIGSFLTAQDTINGKEQWGLSKEEATNLYKAYSGTKFHSYEYKASYVQTKVKLKVPVVILTNNNTASAAEDFLIYLYNQKNIIRIGEYSNGSTGQPLQINLPANSTAWICTKKVTLANGEEFVGIGIKPNVLVEKDLQDVINPSKYDSQLEEAINYLKAN
ncbi:S41 family peptidase [Sphingobacterium cellulitidis]|uniref:S41 family peptidase n=1 Tax=Sphingobacterium cellulitidis TaxID=1768011 RepID=UPI000B94632F|nr:hypothetical protein CHT99_15890 [Sphingobacterium cellulitidis]